MPFLISLVLLISCELQEWRQRGLSLSRDVNLQPFQFHPALQSPSAWTISRPGQRCHLLFISSTIREERKSIVYCNALSPFRHQQNWGAGERSIQIKSKYKKKAVKKRRYITMFGKSICSGFSRPQCFDCSRTVEDNGKVRKLRS